MLILCLDSSGRDLKTGLFEDGSGLAESISDSMGNHSEKIIFEIQMILDKANKKLKNVDRFAINLGPGSFTGLRIGLAAMSGLSLCHKKPLDGYNAFDIMAEDISKETGHYLAVIPCRGDEFYSAYMDVGNDCASRSSEYRIISPTNIDVPKRKLTLIGSGAASFFEKTPQDIKKMLDLGQKLGNLPSLKSLAYLASANKNEKIDNLNIPELFYIAPSQAEVNYARRSDGNNN